MLARNDSSRKLRDPEDGPDFKSDPDGETEARVIAANRVCAWPASSRWSTT